MSSPPIPHPHAPRQFLEPTTAFCFSGLAENPSLRYGTSQELVMLAVYEFSMTSLLRRDLDHVKSNGFRGYLWGRVMQELKTPTAYFEMVSGLAAEMERSEQNAMDLTRLIDRNLLQFPSFDCPQGRIIADTATALGVNRPAFSHIRLSPYFAWFLRIESKYSRYGPRFDPDAVGMDIVLNMSPHIWDPSQALPRPNISIKTPSEFKARASVPEWTYECEEGAYKLFITDLVLSDHALGSRNLPKQLTDLAYIEPRPDRDPRYPPVVRLHTSFMDYLVSSTRGKLLLGLYPGKCRAKIYKSGPDTGAQSWDNISIVTALFLSGWVKRRWDFCAWMLASYELGEKISTDWERIDIYPFFPRHDVSQILVRFLRIRSPTDIQVEESNLFARLLLNIVACDLIKVATLSDKMALEVVGDVFCLLEDHIDRSNFIDSGYIYGAAYCAPIEFLLQLLFSLANRKEGYEQALRVMRIVVGNVVMIVGSASMIEDIAPSAAPNKRLMEGISSPWFIMKAKWSKDEKKRLDLLTNRLYQLARQFGVDLRDVVKGGGPNGRHPMTPGFIYGAHTAFARSQYRFDKTFKSPEINIKQPTPPNLPPCQQPLPVYFVLRALDLRVPGVPQ